MFTVPEVPTIFLQAGMDYLTKNKALFYEGEKATLEIQMTMERSFMKMAEQCEEPTVVICDRGALDISAYLPPEMWTEITNLCGTNSTELRESYDAVLHLVSAADGAEQFYNTTSNEVRTEGLELARSLDKRVIAAWAGHPHLRVINNHEDFDHKLRRVLQEISNVLELPQPIEESRKYIVEVQGEIEGAVKSEITQTYLVAEPNCEVRLRRREWQGKSFFIHTTTKRISQNEQLVTERQISKNLYTSLRQQADPYRQTIEKTRCSFIWKGQYFELDSYKTPCKGLVILETKDVAEGEAVKFPPFLRVLEDITGNKRYYNYNMALK